MNGADEDAHGQCATPKLRSTNAMLVPLLVCEQLHLDSPQKTFGALRYPSFGNVEQRLPTTLNERRRGLMGARRTHAHPTQPTVVTGRDGARLEPPPV